jgi:hypothetical protein
MRTENTAAVITPIMSICVLIFLWIEFFMAISSLP